MTRYVVNAADFLAHANRCRLLWASAEPFFTVLSEKSEEYWGYKRFFIKRSAGLSGWCNPTLVLAKQLLDAGSISKEEYQLIDDLFDLNLSVTTNAKIHGLKEVHLDSYDAREYRQNGHILVRATKEALERSERKWMKFNPVTGKFDE